jgi:hypothetical protein
VPHTWKLKLYQDDVYEVVVDGEQIISGKIQIDFGLLKKLESSYHPT